MICFISPATSPPASPPSLQFPWHLIPFMVLLFILIVILITYYLRIPEIIEAIILAMKDGRKKTKADESLNLTKGNFSVAGFKASSFHSYQRELFYDEALNYAMFEKDTKAVEFSVHLEEEKQNSGSEESVEISCTMEEESDDRKRANDSLSEMFDTKDSDVVRSTSTSDRNDAIYLHDSPTSYDI